MSATKPERDDWTVLLYLAGDNNLTAECVYSLTELRKASRRRDAKINVFAQFDPKDIHLPTMRLKIESRDGRPGRIGDDISDFVRAGNGRLPAFSRRSRALRTIDKNFVAHEKKGVQNRNGVPFFSEQTRPIDRETDCGDPLTLLDFLSLGIEERRAERVMVILSGHGAGTEENFLLKDESSGRSLTIPELKQVFRLLRERRSGKIDILGMDVCCMSMAEIAYELRDSVNVIIASESYSPAAGWPYRRILEKLEFGFSGKHMSDDVHSRFAKTVVDEFVNFYADYTFGGLSVDQAAVDLSQCEALARHVRDLADALISQLSENNTTQSRRGAAKSLKDALILAHWEAQSYSGELFVDLVDFCDCLSKHYPLDAIKLPCERVSEFVKSTFVLRSSYSGPVYQYSHGVSIYFPWADVSPDYEDLEFAKASNWANFLKLYTSKTRRDVRVDHKISRRTRELLGANRSAEVKTIIAVSNAEPPRRFRQVVDREVVEREVVEHGGNPIVSMRNPPIVYLPDKRIKAKGPLILAQKRFFLNGLNKTNGEAAKSKRKTVRKKR